MVIKVNGGNANQSPVHYFDGGFGRDKWFEASIARIIPDRIISSGTTAYITVKDANLSRSSGGQYARDFKVNVIHYPRPGGIATDIQYAVSNNGGGFVQDTNDPSIFRTVLNNKSEVISVSSNQTSYFLNQAFTSRIITTGTVDTFLNFLSTSLAQHCINNIDSRLIGKTRSDTTIQLYNSSNLDKAAGNYTRNSNLWCADLVDKLTCIVPFIYRNSTTGSSLFGATPITKRHLIYPCHIAHPNGSIYDFVNTDNSVVKRTQIQKKLSPNYNPSTYVFDFCVGLLDSDLPNSIYIPKLLPTNWRNFLPNIQYRIPIFSTHEYELASVRDWVLVDNINYAAFTQPINTKRNEFYQSVINGDSGNPVFLIINNELVLLSSWTFGGLGSGVNYSDFIPEINQLIADVDALAGINTGYQVSTIDLSGFPSY